MIFVQIFDSHLKLWHFEVFPIIMSVLGIHSVAMFYAHALSEGQGHVYA